MSQLVDDENFLAPGKYLIYIKNQERFSDVDGYTHIARKVREYMYKDKVWYDFLLETDSDGNQLSTITPITVSGGKIVSERSFHDIDQKKLYHFAPISKGSRINYITARSFVIKSDNSNVLESTSRTALGSGIYGMYATSLSDITDTFESIYQIDCSNAYPLQDKEHGESLTVASLNTNRYLDRIITSFRNDTFDFSSILDRIRINRNFSLFTLWNIVLYRTTDFISFDLLEHILATYVLIYLKEPSIFDTINSDPLEELPINYILRRLGYNGVIATDLFNNGWNRGCVSYNYVTAKIIRGEISRY